MKFLNQNDIKQINAEFVFDIIRKSGVITRKELEKESKLSWGAVSKITSRLIENGYIKELYPQQTLGAGRKPSVIAVNNDDNYILGLDINTSGFRFVLMNMTGEILKEGKSNPVYGNSAEFYNKIEEFAVNSVKLSDGKKISAVGIAMQGNVDGKSGISHSVPMFKDWKDVKLCEKLSKALNLPVYSEHDPECILIASSFTEKQNDAVLIRLDNGIGMAVMRNGKLEGHRGMYEIGHICVYPDGELCSCGKKGCLEQYITVKALEKQTNLGIDKLALKARNGETEALKSFKIISDLLGKVIADISVVLNIKNIIICGDMLSYADLFADGLNRTAKKYGADIQLKITDVKLAAYGAALVAENNIIENLL